jgi:hypothetical protein
MSQKYVVTLAQASILIGPSHTPGWTRYRLCMLSGASDPTKEQVHPGRVLEMQQSRYVWGFLESAACLQTCRTCLFVSRHEQHASALGVDEITKKFTLGCRTRLL